MFLVKFHLSYLQFVYFSSNLFYFSTHFSLRRRNEINKYLVPDPGAAQTEFTASKIDRSPLKYNKQKQKPSPAGGIAFYGKDLFLNSLLLHITYKNNHMLLVNSSGAKKIVLRESPEFFTTAK